MRIAKCKKCKHSKWSDISQTFFCSPNMRYFNKYYACPCKDRKFKDCHIIRKAKPIKMTKEEFVKLYSLCFGEDNSHFDEIYQLGKEEGAIIDE